MEIIGPQGVEMEAFGLLAPEHQTLVLRWIDAIRTLEGATDKRAAIREIEVRHGSALAVTRSSLYRMRERFAQHGWRGLAPKRAIQRAFGSGRGLPPAFVEFVALLACDNQRKFAPAYRQLFTDHLAAGATIPGYKTDWRGIYRVDHDGRHPPATCPYRAYENTPHGWGYRNLLRHMPSIYQIKAARIGLAAASEHLPSVPTTRVGLEYGQVWAFDDVFHDHRVKLLGNRDAQIVVELGAIELLSGHYATHGMKPVEERADGSRKMLKESYMRYLYMDIHCRLGTHADGVLFVGEHGTAAQPKGMQEVQDKWLGKGVARFQAGGIQNRPLARGLYLGLRRGNFRIKAAIESHHNLLKNELAALPGTKGADPEHAPEDSESKRQEHRWLMKAVHALADRSPEVAYLLESEYPEYHRYRAACVRIYESIVTRRHHRLEGWAECGFTVEEFRYDSSSTEWFPVAALRQKPPAEAAAIRALIAADPARRHRISRLAPAEAFALARRRAEAAGKLTVLPMAAGAAILGPDLATTCTVTLSGEMPVRDIEVPGRVHMAAALVETPAGHTRPLPRGTSWKVWLNPFDISRVLVADLQGAFLGQAPVMLPGTKLDRDAAERNMAIVSQMQAKELRGLARVGDERLARRLERTHRNVDALVMAREQGLLGAGDDAGLEPGAPMPAGSDALNAAAADVVGALAEAYDAREDDGGAIW